MCESPVVLVLQVSRGDGGRTCAGQRAAAATPATAQPTGGAGGEERGAGGAAG